MRDRLATKHKKRLKDIWIKGRKEKKKKKAGQWQKDKDSKKTNRPSKDTISDVLLIILEYETNV